MVQSAGRWIPLSLPRRFISDLVYFSKLAPLTTMQRTMQLSTLVERGNIFSRDLVGAPFYQGLFLRGGATAAAASSLYALAVAAHL